MELVVNEVSLLFASVINEEELHKVTKKASECLFPSHSVVELLPGRTEQEQRLKSDERFLKLIYSRNSETIIEKVTQKQASQIFEILSGGTVAGPLASQDEHNVCNIITFDIHDPLEKNNFKFILITENLPNFANKRAVILKQQITGCLRRIQRIQRLRSSDSDGELGTTTSLVNCEHAYNFCDISNDIDFWSLQQKLMQHLYEMTNAKTGFLIMQLPETNEYVCHFVADRNMKEPIFVDMTGNFLNEIMGQNSPKVISILSQEMECFIRNMLNFPNVNHGGVCANQSNAEISIDSVLVCPVLNRQTNVVCGAVFLVNKQHTNVPNTKHATFATEDLLNVEKCVEHIMPLLRCALSCENERKLKTRNEKMLEVAGNIFKSTPDLTNLLLKIMQEARNLTAAERCSVFLVETETDSLVAKVLDGLPTAQHKGEIFITAEGNSVELPEEVRLKLDQGIAGKVAATGEILNIKDAYKHPLFYRGVDEETGFKTRNILCFPIKNEKDGIVGVAQLCNKIGFPYFTQADEEVARVFSVFCCISIVQSLVYKKVQDAQYRVRIANELMTYHMKISEDKLEWLSGIEIPPLQSLLANPNSFECIPRSIERDDETYLALMRMFYDLNLVQRWRIPHQTLARFILTVRRGYRSPAYHNWMHAFSVGHFLYACVKRLKLSEDYFLTELEVLALFVAAICHDIDHRGTNNTFQIASKSVLAALYSSEGSVLERHHLSQTICILNTNECNIFTSLSAKDYERILDLIRDIILSTDLAHHLKIIHKQKQMIIDGYDRSDPDHHSLLLALLMTASDLSDQTKNWQNTTHVAKLIYEEFFGQGDLEKSLGQEPTAGMDREKACVPQLQISFLDFVIIPLYETLAKQFPQTRCFLATIHENRSRWNSILRNVQKGKLNGSGLQIFQYDLTNPAYFSE